MCAQTPKKARELLANKRGLKVSEKRVRALLAGMDSSSPPEASPATAPAPVPVAAPEPAPGPAPEPAPAPAPRMKYVGRGAAMAPILDDSPDEQILEALKKCRSDWHRSMSFKMKVYRGRVELDKEGLVCGKAKLREFVKELESSMDGTAGESAGDGSIGAASVAGPDRDAVLTFQSPRQTALALQQAGEAKDAGAAAFKAADYALAVREWSSGVEALRSCPAEPEVETLRLALFNNRAFAHAKLGQDLRAVEADVAEVLLRDPSNVKAIFRRAQARATLREWEGAVADLGKVLELQPGNKLAARDLTAAREALAKLAAAGADGAQAAAGTTDGSSPPSPGKKLNIVEVDQTSSSEDGSDEDEAASQPDSQVASQKRSLVRKLAAIDVGFHLDPTEAT